MGLKKKVIVFCAFSVAVPVLILGVCSYVYTSSGIYSMVQDKLRHQVAGYRSELEQNYVRIKAEEKQSRERAKTIVQQQAQLIFKIGDRWTGTAEGLKDELAQIKVSKQGMYMRLIIRGIMW